MNGQYNVGDVVLHNWTLTRMIGAGAFGRVFEARRKDLAGEYDAAIKIITIPRSQAEISEVLSEGMTEESVSEYFHGVVREISKEFALMAKLKGDSNIVSYEDHEVVQHTRGIGWDIIIRMELLTPFSKIMESTLTKQDIIQLGIDICCALECCQQYHIIHRDIKPDNIFRSKTGRYKLGDFGIARTIDKTNGGSTTAGTPFYMAPEIMRREKYGATVDIYSLGIVLYRLLNDNRLPFMPPAPASIKHTDWEAALARRVRGEQLPPPVNAQGRLAEIVLKACAYRPEDRYASPYAMRKDLEGLLTGDQPKPEPPPKPAKKSAGRRIAAAVGIFAVLLAAGTVSLSRMKDRSSSASLPAAVTATPAVQTSAPTPAPAPSPNPTPSPEPAAAAGSAVGGISLTEGIQKGDIITFGSYEQDNILANGKEPIEWQVLDIQDGKAFLISKKALDDQPYHTERIAATWNTCSLRTWLNDDFLNTAFTAEERERILTVTVSADENPGYGTDPGDPTQDKVFLLSVQEADRYFALNKDRQCEPTAYTVKQGGFIATNGYCWWWLRSPGEEAYDAARVTYNGDISSSALTVSYVVTNPVRPALWISVDANAVPAEEEPSGNWFDAAVTEANFAEFYDIEMVDSVFATDPDSVSIYPQLSLSYLLKPEFREEVDRDNSYVEISVSGNYVFRELTSINWETGEISFAEDTSADKIVSLQQIALANGNVSLADKLNRQLSETAGGTLEISIPLNRLADGVFDYNNGIHGPVSPLAKADFADSNIFLAKLEDLKVTAVHGSLRLKDYGSQAAPDTENLEYLPLQNGQAVITRYTGAGESVAVPDAIEGYTISRIGDYAFAYRENLKKVVLPDSITAIGIDAFAECRNLESITLPAGITSINDRAFYKCIKMTAIVNRGSYAEQYCIENDLLYQYEDGSSLAGSTVGEDEFAYRLLKNETAEITQYSGTVTRLTVPEQIAGYKVTSIAKSAFEQSKIVTIALPDTIETIGDFAFAACNDLVSVSLPASLRSIGESAFNSCINLASITIPDGVTKIRDNTFYFCIDLSEVILPDSLTVIEEEAFRICSHLTSITIPGSVTAIGENAFTDGIVITVEPGSYAEQYCIAHSIQYQF